MPGQICPLQIDLQRSLSSLMKPCQIDGQPRRSASKAAPHVVSPFFTQREFIKESSHILVDDTGVLVHSTTLTTGYGK